MTTPLTQNTKHKMLETHDTGQAATVAARQARRRARIKAETGSTQTEAEKLQIKAWRRTDAGKASKRAAYHAVIDDKPFLPCDGEGCGEDSLKRQHYMLLRLGDRELYTGSPLTIEQCLEHILGIPKGVIAVGYGWRYDIPQILRQLPPERWKRLWQREHRRPGHSPYVFWQDYGIDWLDNNYLRVCRTRRTAKGGRRAIPGTARTIYEVAGFFQKPFVTALKDFGIGSPEHLAFIGKNKEFRGLIPEIDAETREYCRLECDYLAVLMTEFRRMCLTVDPPLRPQTWNGGGKLADAEHKRCGTMKRQELHDRLAAIDALPVLTEANHAYYGGRFEVIRIGDLPRVYSNDINSAYPHAMQSLPCLHHGTWRPVTGADLDLLTDPDAVYVADVYFRHEPPPHLNYVPICGLPIRSKKCALTWPLEGNGTYWSVELRAARKLGAVISHKSGWLYERHCDCHRFQWVKDRYDWRVSVGKDKQGYPVKIAINSVYGKLAQRIGSPLFQNPIHAGLITAHCRAQLMEAAAVAPETVVMFATDALFTLEPLPHLRVSKQLGDWDAAEHPRLFIVQPGLYWGMRNVDGSDKIKTRGISPKFIRTELPRFEASWHAWCEKIRAVWHDRVTRKAVLAENPPPKVEVRVKYFVGMRMAHARNNPDLAGRWIGEGDGDPPRNISFDWSNKRLAAVIWETPTCVVTMPQPGSATLQSHFHDEIKDEDLKQLMEFRMTMEAGRDVFISEPEDVDD